MKPKESHLSKVNVGARIQTQAIRCKRWPHTVLVSVKSGKGIYLDLNSANYKYAFVLAIFLLPLIAHILLSCSVFQGLAYVNSIAGLPVRFGTSWRIEVMGRESEDNLFSWFLPVRPLLVDCIPLLKLQPQSNDLLHYGF